MNYFGYETPIVAGWGATTKQGNYGDHYILFYIPGIYIATYT